MMVPPQPHSCHVPYQGSPGQAKPPQPCLGSLCFFVSPRLFPYHRPLLPQANTSSFDHTRQSSSPLSSVARLSCSDLAVQHASIFELPPSSQSKHVTTACTSQHDSLIRLHDSITRISCPTLWANTITQAPKNRTARRVR